MIPLLFYYLLLPMLGFWLVLKFIRRYGADPVPARVRESCAADPIEPRTYRVLRVEGALGSGGERLRKLGDYDGQEKALDAAYAERGADPAEGVSWLVLDSRGDILRLVA